jgi:uncharacterized protein YxeA
MRIRDKIQDLFAIILVWIIGIIILTILIITPILINRAIDNKNYKFVKEHYESVKKMIEISDSLHNSEYQYSK